MKIEEFKNKYEEMKDTDIYKSYCSVLESKDLILRRVLEDKQELIEYLKEQIKEYEKELSYRYQEDYEKGLEKGYFNAYEDILSKIEKR